MTDIELPSPNDQLVIACNECESLHGINDYRIGSYITAMGAEDALMAFILKHQGECTAAWLSRNDNMSDDPHLTLGYLPLFRFENKNVLDSPFSSNTGYIVIRFEPASGYAVRDLLRVINLTVGYMVDNAMVTSNMTEDQLVQNEDTI